MKHAFLIIAHNEFEVLQTLIDRLDSELTDVYVHIDRKVQEVPVLHAAHSQLCVLEQRVDVRWGHVSQIECEMLLFETALQRGPYAHYHLLSGTHLPLVSLDDLLRYYNCHAGEEIMDIWETCTGRGNIKLGKWNLWLRHHKSPHPLVRCFAQWFWRLNMAVQKRLPIYRFPDECYVKTSNWLSLTQRAVEFLVGRRDAIRHLYRYSLCGDEYFVASELAKGDFRICDDKHLLFQIWEGDGPRVLTPEDAEAMLSSGCLWARKFSHAFILDSTLTYDGKL